MLARGLFQDGPLVLGEPNFRCQLLATRLKQLRKLLQASNRREGFGASVASVTSSCHGLIINLGLLLCKVKFEPRPSGGDGPSGRSCRSAWGAAPLPEGWRGFVCNEGSRAIRRVAVGSKDPSFQRDRGATVGAVTITALAISGSPRENGNTQTLLQRCLDRLATHGIAGELVTLIGKTLRGCNACCACTQSRDATCPGISDDDFAAYFEKMVRADIIVVGSPVYFGSAAPELMALLDRAGYVSRANGQLFSRKLGGPIAVARRAGHNFTFAQLLFWYMINDMIVPGSSYWNVALAKDPGAVLEDQEALATIDRFADNLAWLAQKTHVEPKR